MYPRRSVSGAIWGIALFALVMGGCRPGGENPGEEDGLPGAPTRVSATVTTTSPWKALVQWSAPEESGRGPILQYTVVAAPGGKTVTTSETSVWFSGLPADSYTFTVHATNVAGDGPPSEPSSPVSMSAEPGVPAAPTGVMATPAEDSVLVTWAHVDSGSACGHFFQESCITSYVVTVNPGGTQLTVEQPGSVGPSDYTPRRGRNFAVVTGLPRDTAHTFTVHATNRVGAGPASSPTQPVTQQCTTFASPVSLTTGLDGDVLSTPAIATGDVNGDGRPDVVVARHGLRVFVNQGGTAFAEPVALSSEGRFNSIVLKELNGDGRVDIAALEDTGLKVFLNAGDGSFSAPVSYGTGSKLVQLQAADVTGDATTDLLLVDASFEARALLVFPNKGDGSFSAPVRVLTDSISGWAPGDLNRDGKVDLAVVLSPSSGKLKVLLNAGPGSFTELPAHALAVSGTPAVADMNGDGNLDLVFRSAVLPGKGDGTFQEPRSHLLAGWGTGGFALGDVDKDGKLDALTAVPGSAQDSVVSSMVGLLRNDGQGQLSASSAHPSRPDPREVLLDDLDGDGWLDAVVAHATTHELSILRDCHP